MSVGAVVVAAGRGERFGTGERKQFLELDGRPVAERACRPFLDDPAVAEVVLVLPPESAADPPGWADAAGVRVVSGGASRRESVTRGLAALDGSVSRVLVHDGVRPLVSAVLVGRVLEALGEAGVVPALAVHDTVKEVAEDRVVRTLDRSRLRRVQTPQGFPRDVLERAHREVPSDAPATDDAALVEAIGHDVRVVEGEESNLKITTPEDLVRAEWLLARAPAGTSGCGGEAR